MARSELNTIEQHKTERRKSHKQASGCGKSGCRASQVGNMTFTSRPFNDYKSFLFKKILGCTLTSIHIPMPQHCLVCLCCWQTDVLCEAFITFSGAYCNMKDVLISDIDKNLWYLRMCARFGCLTDFVWVLCAQTYKRAEILSKMIWVCLSSSLWACENGSLCRTMTVIPKQLM